METMNDYGFRQYIKEGLKQLNIDTPTPIQSRTIPEFMVGNDVIVQSKTGTGKTLAFLLPILQKLHFQSDETHALILAPSRELAQQTFQVASHFFQMASAEEIDREGHAHKPRAVLLSGGVDPERQFKKLKHAPNLIVATPGRLQDALAKKLVTLDHLKWIIVDEADTMIKMGFIEMVGEWLKKSPRTQKGLFSATMPDKIKRIVLPYMRTPSLIQVADKWTPVKELDLHVFEVPDTEREAKFMELAKLYNPYLAVVFTNTRTKAMQLGDAMTRAGFNLLVLHGELQARQRKQVTQRFRSGEFQWLVATDLAARGLDVEGISHVFHYELPQNMEWFMHRNGRTARAGMDGIAIAIVAAHEWNKLRDFEQQTGVKMTSKKIHAGEIADRLVAPRKTRPLVEGKTRASADEVRSKRSLSESKTSSSRSGSKRNFRNGVTRDQAEKPASKFAKTAPKTENKTAVKKEKERPRRGAGRITNPKGDRRNGKV